jgi:hypothetical protein
MLRFFRRVTPLTWFIWGLTVANLAAPGYLKFNLGIAIVDASKVIESINVEVVTARGQD